MFCSLLILTSGCSLFGGKPNKSSDSSWSISKLWKKEYQKPASISIIWSPDVLTMTGKPPTRGFGGRVFFYNERTQAIPVEGELIVHGYRGDPMLGESEQVKADKKFAFTAEQLTSHFSPSQLGASYSIWIPWDSADGFRDEITLIPTFVGLDGSILQGAPAKLNLPGRSLDSLSAAGEQSRSGIPAQTVSYQSQSIPTNDTGSLPKLTTMPLTIDLPPLGTIGRPRSRSALTSQGFTLGPGNVSQAPTPLHNSATSSGFTLPNNAASAQSLSLPQVPASVQPAPNTASNATQSVSSASGVQPASDIQPAQRLSYQPWRADLK